jgi:non-ribosomal peptide synthase protein (TIGR01720 family)
MIRINEDVDAGPMVQRELEIRSIFGYVLNIPEASLGPKTSFFRIGGDSISAMQVATLCRAKGIHLTMQDILIHKTIARLATSTTVDSQSSLDLSTLTEEYGVPHQLSPIQTMFFDLIPDGNNLYDQSFYLKLKFNLLPERISDAITTITRRHSMLRAVFSKSGDGSWVQTIRPPEEKVHSFQSYDISRPQDALNVIDKSRKLVDFEKGLTFAVALMTAPERQTLFMTCHHLVVDLVSWRTILRDLEDLLRLGQLLPLYSVPFTVWSDLQIKQAKAVEPESIVPTTRPDTNKDFWGIDGIVNTVRDNIQQSFYLDADTTAVLLQQNEQGTLVEPIDVFIRSLVHAFRETFVDRKTPTVFFEGHRREPWDKAIDVTNTVGWFTSMCLISIENEKAAYLLKAIQGTRDLRRSIKDNGRAFWASRFYYPTGQELFGRFSKIEMSFNYTGLIQQLERDDAMFEVVDEGEYETDDPSIVRFALFDVAVLINNGRMRVLFTWNKKMQHQKRIREWIKAYQRRLENLVATVNSSWDGSTVGDMVNLSLSQSQIQYMIKSVRPSEGLLAPSYVKHIAPCAAIQQHMLNTELTRPGFINSEFLFQISLPEHEKKIDLTRFTGAWQQTVNRHLILSTYFLKPDVKK